MSDAPNTTCATTASRNATHEAATEGATTARRAVTTRLIRRGSPNPPEQDWATATVSERIAGVWTLTQQCFAWNREGADEPRLRVLLAEFNAAGVEFVVVGAHALAAHGLVRATKDLDIWIRPTAPNAARVFTALRRFGAPLQDLTSDDLSEPGAVFQIGVEPIRIDLLTDIDGVTFDDAWQGRVIATFADQPVGVLGYDELIRNKRAAGRDQDLVDVRWLERNRPDR